MNAASLASFRAQGQATRETLQPARGNPATFVLTLGEETTGEIVAAISIKAVTQTLDKHGQLRNIQPCIVAVSLSLLPGWAANENDLPTKAKVIADGKTFKVSAARSNGTAMLLTAFRWPDDE